MKNTKKKTQNKGRKPLQDKKQGSSRSMGKKTKATGSSRTQSMKEPA